MRLFLLLFALLLTMPAQAAAPKPLYRDPVYDGAADVSIIYDRGAGLWKMFYTNRRATMKLADPKDVEWVHGTAIGIATSADGKQWRYQGTAALPKECTSVTSWAPELYYEDGVYHMWLTVVPGIFHRWGVPGAAGRIVHLTSPDLGKWACDGTIDAGASRIIDASVLKLGDQHYRLWYKDENAGSVIKSIDSKDLRTWVKRSDQPVSTTHAEGPKAFRFKGQYWMVADAWKGLMVLRSDDAEHWTQQDGYILAEPGAKPTDKGLGQHPDVVVQGERAFIYYFVHQGKEPEADSDPRWNQRTVIQVAELLYRDGKLTVDRNADLDFQLSPPAAAYQASFTVRGDQPAARISRNLYGQFVEQLGRGVYEGIWVGEQSPIPNTRGIRNDVVAALRQLEVPVVRWPGGCYADVYHWRDGVGPRQQRPETANSWENVAETNAFGTHEFMDFVTQIGAQPYISVNLATGTPAESKAWIDYMTAPAGTPSAKARQQNGRDAPWELPFIGIGNESWGCGGNMRADFYADQYRLHRGFLNGYAKARPYFIAAGPDSDDYHWTEVVMAKAMDWREKPVAPLLYNSKRPIMDGLALHFYTLTTDDWSDKGSDTNFQEAGWISTLKRALTMDELIRKHSAIMDRYDPDQKVGLIVDEWGTWFRAEQKSSMLYQQNTLRDALVAAVTLNIFQDHAERVRMANIAQLANVLQAMVLTQGEKMILTPTYHVFEMYKVHHDATRIPVELSAPQYRHGGLAVPALSVSASRDAAGKLHLTVANLDPQRSVQVAARLNGISAQRVTGRVLTADAINTHNDFASPDRFVPVPLAGASVGDGVLRAEFPAKSVVVLTLE